MSEQERWRKRRLESLVSRFVLGMRVDATSYEDASRRVVQWAQHARSAYVSVATVHTTMEPYDSAAFRQAVNGAALWLHRTEGP
jgi:N-acetylglucosaminyldiphosphoundecaprenol N-acetyl-beta-D-mannosaminyltransferase